jgi:hypothetical protein
MQEEEEEEEGLPIVLSNQDQAFLVTDPFVLLNSNLVVNVGGRVASPGVLQPGGTHPPNGIWDLDITMNGETEVYLKEKNTNTYLHLMLIGNPSFTKAINSSKTLKSFTNGFVNGSQDSRSSRESDESDEDSFIVDDDAEIIEEGTCGMCGRDEGEVIICKSRDRGCGAEYHPECIGRTSKPSGDWICQRCASKQGMDCGKGGHEYSVKLKSKEPMARKGGHPKKTKGRLAKKLRASDTSSDEEFWDSQTAGKKGNIKRKRVLEDSDEEE